MHLTKRRKLKNESFFACVLIIKGRWTSIVRHLYVFPSGNWIFCQLSSYFQTGPAESNPTS